MHKINIPRLNGQEPLKLSLEAGDAAVFVGANGSGKTKLGVFLNKALNKHSHRVNASKNLVFSSPGFNPNPIEETRDQFLWGYKHFNPENKDSNRQPNQTSNDFNQLLAFLITENTALASEYTEYKKKHPGSNKQVPESSFDKCSKLWAKILKKQSLTITLNRRRC